MRRGLALEPIAVEEYCKVREVNHYPCGFLIHPEAPWMGSTPDGLVCDPEGQPVFGLLEIKCPNVTSYVDCPYVMIKEGTHTLRRTHPYNWQVQGQMLIFLGVTGEILSFTVKMTCSFREFPVTCKSFKQRKS